MNSKRIGIFVLFAAAMFQAEASAAPEAQVSSPVEESFSQAETSLGERNVSWDAKRAERREARERILNRLRESSAVEKEAVRKELSKNRGESSRTESPFPKTSRDSRMEGSPWREDRRMRGPGPGGMPPPEYGDPNN